MHKCFYWVLLTLLQWHSCVSSDIYSDSYSFPGWEVCIPHYELLKWHSPVEHNDRPWMTAALQYIMSTVTHCVSTIIQLQLFTYLKPTQHYLRFNLQYYIIHTKFSCNIHNALQWLSVIRKDQASHFVLWVPMQTSELSTPARLILQLWNYVPGFTVLSTCNRAFGTLKPWSFETGVQGEVFSWFGFQRLHVDKTTANISTAYVRSERVPL